jgi:hypothetical protein
VERSFRQSLDVAFHAWTLIFRDTRRRNNLAAGEPEARFHLRRLEPLGVAGILGVEKELIER